MDGLHCLFIYLFVCLSVDLQVVVNYVAVVMCVTDSIDEPRTRCGASSKSPSVTRSAARFLSQRDYRRQSTRINVGTTSTNLSIDPSRRESPLASLGQHRRLGADCYRNGRPTTRCAVVERTQDAASEVRRQATVVLRANDDGGATSAAGFSPTLVSDVREVRRLMTALQSRIAAKDAAELIARDWRLVATCLDRIMFCFYCSVVAVSLAAYFPRSEA